ncbi:MAG: hypothetical protein AUK63_1742 [bacterium P3]|nr:MAG: hypothetical protein AUK63_1742 [bacterium P3]KWW38702.1 MAG: hypothetical protein F083_2156 [bacterium F083]
MIPLAGSGHTHFARDLFESAFPDEERPPFDELSKRDSSRFHFLLLLSGDDPVGILTYWDFEDFVYVEHFAIDEEMRDQGFGKAAFLNFLSDQHKQVLFEVELPHDEESEHRVEFYSSMGLCQNPQDYIQPSYRDPQRLVIPMLIMSKYELDDDAFDEMRDTLYREVYRRNL